jgi:hypothetical protein
MASGQMLDELSPIALAGRLGLAISMAVFMGLAFEGVYKREEHTSPGGIRTFPMLAALGAMLYLIDSQSLLPYVVGLSAVALWLYAHIRIVPDAPDARPSLMIPIANLLAYTFGPVSLAQPPWIVVTTAVAAVLLLEGREALHRLVLQVAPDEVFTLGKFLILVGIVLPLLPNHPVVSWTPITPFNVWLALVAVSTFSYVSYLLQRYLPMKSGALLPSILGGLYSSTATTGAGQHYRDVARDSGGCHSHRSFVQQCPQGRLCAHVRWRSRMPASGHRTGSPWRVGLRRGIVLSAAKRPVATQRSAHGSGARRGDSECRIAGNAVQIHCLRSSHTLMICVRLK